MLDKAVDLSEFRLLLVIDTSVRVRDAERREKRFAAVKGVCLGTVVRGQGDGLAVAIACGGKFLFAEDGLAAAL